MKRVVQLVRLTAPERGDLVEAVALCTLASVLLQVVRFRRLAPHLGRHMAESPSPQEATIIRQVVWVRWAIETAARHLPWKPVCLPQE